MHDEETCPLSGGEHALESTEQSLELACACGAHYDGLLINLGEGVRVASIEQVNGLYEAGLNICPNDGLAAAKFLDVLEKKLGRAVLSQGQVLDKIVTHLIELWRKDQRYEALSAVKGWMARDGFIDALIRVGLPEDMQKHLKTWSKDGKHFITIALLDIKPEN